VPTKHRGNDTERHALDAYIKLSRATAAVDARINRPLAQFGLTTSQFGVLEAVWHLGPLSHGDISRKLLKSSGNVTTVIDNLAKRGLVRREGDERDRRVSRVALTEAGRSLLERIFPAHVQRVVEAFRALTPGELDTLAALLRRLGRGADVPVATPPPSHATSVTPGTQPTPIPPQEDPA